MPVCKSCGVDKPRKDFSEKQIRCKPCRQDKYRDSKRRWNLENKYGITLEEYDEMAKDGCHICGKTSDEDRSHLNNRSYLNVDHDHETGKLRGVLCTPCNTGLGKLGDNVAGLTRALEYLNASN